MASARWTLSWGYWPGLILPSLPFFIVLEDLKTASGIPHRAITLALLLETEQFDSPSFTWSPNNCPIQVLAVRSMTKQQN